MSLPKFSIKNIQSLNTKLADIEQIENYFYNNHKIASYIYKKLNEAFEFYANSDYRISKIACEEIMRETTICDKAYYLYSLLNFQNDDYDQAKDYILKAISVNPNVPDYYFVLANIELALNNDMRFLGNKYHIKSIESTINKALQLKEKN